MQAIDHRPRLQEIERKTFSYHLDPRVVERVNELVRDGKYANKSHATEEALKLLVAANDGDADV